MSSKDAEKSKYSYPSAQSVPTTIKLLVGQREKLDFFLIQKTVLAPKISTQFSLFDGGHKYGWTLTMFGRCVEKDNIQVLRSIYYNVNRIKRVFLLFTLV